MLKIILSRLEDELNQDLLIFKFKKKAIPHYKLY